MGSTVNIERRIKEHKTKKTVYIRRYFGEFELVFVQEYGEISQARRVEQWLKAQKDRDFLERVVGDGMVKKVID